MNTVFAAFYGEYEEPYPIGVYDTVGKAKKAVENSNPSFNTEVIEYNLETGEQVSILHFNKSTSTWRDME